MHIMKEKHYVWIFVYLCTKINLSLNTTSRNFSITLIYVQKYAEIDAPHRVLGRKSRLPLPETPVDLAAGRRSVSALTN